MTDSGPIWVTGADGFLGAAACARLREQGYAVQPIVRRPSAREPVDDAAATARKPAALLYDLVADRLEPVAGEPSPTTIVHLAAERPTSFHADEVGNTAARNRRMDENVFAFAASVRAGVVFASGGSVYGGGQGEVFTEDGATNPWGQYPAAKLRSEQQGAAILEAGGAPFAALRISAPYGPGQKAPTVVHHFLSRAIAGDSLTYHGTGSRMQDFVYVDDVAEAVCCCVSAGAEGVFNIASGQPVSMKELAARVAEVVGRSMHIGPSGEPDEQEGLTAFYSIEAAERVLAWKPATGLRTGLQRWCDCLASDSP